MLDEREPVLVELVHRHHVKESGGDDGNLRRVEDLKQVVYDLGVVVDGFAPNNLDLDRFLQLHELVDSLHEIQQGALELIDGLLRRRILAPRNVDDPDDVVERGHEVDEHLELPRVGFDGRLVLDPLHIVVDALEKDLVHLCVLEGVPYIRLEDSLKGLEVALGEVLEDVREEVEDRQHLLQLPPLVDEDGAQGVHDLPQELEDLVVRERVHSRVLPQAAVDDDVQVLAVKGLPVDEVVKDAVLGLLCAAHGRTDSQHFVLLRKAGPETSHCELGLAVLLKVLWDDHAALGHAVKDLVGGEDVLAVLERGAVLRVG
mmetsp:Transcript_869/g.1549  ORF Transcript_869/g.1549 Transcript_869/m.1549 type:complete len:316 (-) Transcript_869:1612-2559(-)